MKLAMLQMRVEPGNASENLAGAAGLVSEAASQAADIIVLPEVLDFGWTHPAAIQLGGTIPGGKTCEALRELASSHKIHLCAGLAERADDQLFNAAVLIDPTGEILLHHRKINELIIARNIYQCGDSVASCDTAYGRIGVMICADGFADDLWISRQLASEGAKLILSPSAWAVPADHDNAIEPYGQLWLDSYQPVCREFDCHIAGVSNVGPVFSGAWAGRKCIGCSLLVGPDGSVIARGNYGERAEQIIYAEI